VEKKIFLALGGFFMVWGMIGFVTPLSNNGFTTMQIDNFCQSLSSEKEIIVENSFGPCQVSRFLMMNSYGYLIFGAGIVGVSSISFRKKSF
jgi:hypothetical protein